MKTVFNTALLLGLIGLTTQCQQPKQGEAATAGETVENPTDEATTIDSPAVTDTALYASLEPATATLSLQDSLPIRFTVTNPTADSLKFTAYHTPFEGLISKFLTVTDSEGQEISYQGPMAKRVMPPPADSYHTVAPGASESVTFDLKRAYKIEKAGTYTLQYNAEAISGVKNGEALTVTVSE